jgi:hypothetical protein
MNEASPGPVNEAGPGPMNEASPGPVNEAGSGHGLKVCVPMCRAECVFLC